MTIFSDFLVTVDMQMKGDIIFLQSKQCSL